VGYASLGANTTGTANSALGHLTLDANTTGDCYTVAFGEEWTSNAAAAAIWKYNRQLRNTAFGTVALGAKHYSL
jgi:hypothetical protein